MGADSDIQYLPGMGPKRASLLRTEMGISTIGDLLRLYPYRYTDRTTILKIRDITPTSAAIQFCGKVVGITFYGIGGTVLPPDNTVKAKRLSVIVTDGTGQMEVVFFKGIKYNARRMAPGTAYLFFGKPNVFNGKLSFVHPETDPLPQGITLPYPADNAAGTMSATKISGGYLSGVYSMTEKMRNAGFTGKLMGRIMDAALAEILPYIEETLPDFVMKDNGLVPLRYALRNIHFPENVTALERASFRLKFEELFLLQLSLLKQKYIRSRNAKGIAMPMVGEAFNICYKGLPYDLTGAQKRVIKEIRTDMMSGRQMNRLLQGDVGSGKTMVAVLSALIAVGNGCQACIMAPTEVLANQHFANIQKYLKGTGVQSALLTGSTRTAERRSIMEGLENGSIHIVTGTHALIEDPVVFHKLGLAVIDEQHRFGVDQRSRLWNKGKDGIPPHILVMTATPIPRTLAMTLYGDLDLSVIDEMPPGRKPVETMQITERRRTALFRFIKDQIALGRQTFIVYPMIFENEKVDYKNLEEGYDMIADEFPLPDYKIAIVHGKQSVEEKNFNMSAFAAGRANILVATTVIEVGVDVPNASVMVIEGAERFGLSQLHQLRGRVGRGSEKAYCILVKGDKLSAESQKRIDLLCNTENGFVLAEEDMKMRGPGSMDGTMQSGLPIELNIASLAKDGPILTKARDYALKVLEHDPGLEMPGNSLLAKEIAKSKYNVRDYSNIS